MHHACLALFSILLTTPSLAPTTLGLAPRTAPPVISAPVLTDDIVRRLHRMGFDGIKIYNARPPERDGLLCAIPTFSAVG